MSGFMNLLIPDDCGRRAFEETVADWREERARAESAMARIGVDLRALLSLGRVFVMVGRAGLMQSQVWMCLLATIVTATALTTTQIWRYAADPKGVITVPELLSLLPSGVAVFGAMTVSFGFGLNRHDRFPGMTLVAATILMTSLTLGFIAPVSNQYFRVSVLARQAQSAVLERGIPELTAPELVRRALTDESGAAAARSALLQRTAIAIAAPAMLLLGAALRARLHRRRGWRTSQIAGGIAAFVIFLSGGAMGAGLGEIILAYWSWPERGLDTLPWWIAIAVSVAVTWFLARSSGRDAAPAGG